MIRRLRKILKYLLLIMIALIVAGALYGWVLYRNIRTLAEEDHAHAADVMVILGAAQYNGRPSPVLKARLDHAVELFRAGLAPRVVVTGGMGTGDRISEATVGHRYLRAQSVPDSAIIVRPDGRTTDASMRSVLISVTMSSGSCASCA